MAELVGGSLLSAFLQVMFDRIASPNVVAFLRGKNSTGKSLQRLKTTLYAAGAVLHDADRKQITDSAVKSWLDDLRDAIYRVDDLIDEISTQAETRVEVQNCFYRSFNLNARKMNFKIDDVVDKLESILKHNDILVLRDVVGRETLSWRHQSTLVDEFDVFGRENEKHAILELLLSDDIDNNKISVIPILGMGGIGKTTLAQVAYNNDQVKQKFDLRAWVCVSEEFDVSKITKSIVESITSHACGMKELNLLQLDLKDKLSGKKFIGLKKLSSQNQALLMKIGFALISRPDQLWVQVLRAKYKFRPEGRVPPNVINCSHLWRSLTKLFQDIKLGFITLKFNNIQISPNFQALAFSLP